MVKQNGTRWDGIENRKQCDALRLCKYVCKYTCISTSVITHKGWHVHLCQFVSLRLLYLSVPLSNRLHPSIHAPTHPYLRAQYVTYMSGKFLYLHILHKFLSGSISSPLWMQGLAKACLGEHCSKPSGTPACPFLISSAMLLRLGFWLPL